MINSTGYYGGPDPRGATARDIERIYTFSDNRIREKLTSIRLLYSVSQEPEKERATKVITDLKLVEKKEACERKVIASLGIGLFGVPAGILGAKAIGLMTAAVAATSAVIVVVAVAIFIDYHLRLRFEYRDQIEEVLLPSRILQSAIYSIDQIDGVSKGSTNIGVAIPLIGKKIFKDFVPVLERFTEICKDETVCSFPTTDVILNATRYTEQELLNQIFATSLKLISQVRTDLRSNVS